MKFDAEEELLSRLGLGYQILDSACCGMAGGFGFEKVHYDVSVKAGERVLFPEVRKADADTLIIADGFSCREQIAQATGRRALHVAEAIRMALPPGLRLAIPGQVPLRPRVGQAHPCVRSTAQSPEPGETAVRINWRRLSIHYPEGFTAIRLISRSPGFQPARPIVVARYVPAPQHVAAVQ